MPWLIKRKVQDRRVDLQDREWEAIRWKQEVEKKNIIEHVVQNLNWLWESNHPPQLVSSFWWHTVYIYVNHRLSTSNLKFFCLVLVTCKCSSISDWLAGRPLEPLPCRFHVFTVSSFLEIQLLSSLSALLRQVLIFIIQFWLRRCLYYLVSGCLPGRLYSSFAVSRLIYKNCLIIWYCQFLRYSLTFSLSQITMGLLISAPRYICALCSGLLPRLDFTFICWHPLSGS